MRYDAWSRHVKMTDPDAVVKSEPFEETFSPVEKVWSDESRAAALEARRRNASGKTPEDAPGKSPKDAPGNLGGHQGALSRHGWENTGDYSDNSKLYSHGGAPGEEIEVHPGGNWRHTAPGPAVPKTDEQGRRTLYPARRVDVRGEDAASLKAHLASGARVSEGTAGSTSGRPRVPHRPSPGPMKPAPRDFQVPPSLGSQPRRGGLSVPRMLPGGRVQRDPVPKKSEGPRVWEAKSGEVIPTPPPPPPPPPPKPRMPDFAGSVTTPRG